jgi:hypothetical protein
MIFKNKKYERKMVSQNRFELLGNDEPNEQSMNNIKKDNDSIYISHMMGDDGFINVVSKRRKKYIQTEYDIRSKGFEALADKSIMINKLKGTRMCSFVVQGKKCPRPEGTCWFAHDEKELILTPCFFGEACRNLKSKTKKCIYRHPQETKQEYLYRKDEGGMINISLKI